MNVLHISDIHYRSAYQKTNPYEEMLSHMDSSLERLKAVITDVMAVSSIDLIVISGDICDEGSANDYALLKKYFDSLSVPVLVTIGNHDIRPAFYEGWLGEKKDEPYLTVMKTDDLTWISFDNSLHGKPCGYVDEERLVWLKKQLDENENCIVVMHHQFPDLPGIPGMDGSQKIRKVLEEHKPLAVLNGHTHWIKDEVLDGIPYFTAPSISFRAVNEKDGSVVFSQSSGYRIYSVSNDGVKPLQECEKQGKELALWK